MFDEVTEITYEESRDVVEYARGRDVEVIDLAKGDATRQNVEETLKKYPDALAYHADHGNETSWIGADEKACVDLSNVQFLANRECYANNCSSAKTLGVEAWKLKATYWGYKEVFVFTVEEESYFKQFVNHGIKLRIDGNTWELCLKKTKELANKLVDELVSAGKAFAAACLRHDADILVCYNAEVPSSDCVLRRIAIRVFGPEKGWRLRETLRKKHFLNVLGIILSVAVLLASIWQLDIICVNPIWSTTGFCQWFLNTGYQNLSDMPFQAFLIKTTVGRAYDSCLTLIFLSFLLLFLSLWFWD